MSISRRIKRVSDAGEQPTNVNSFGEALHGLANSIKRSRGRPKTENAKQQISIRLERSVVEKWKATEPTWQTRVNKAQICLKKGDRCQGFYCRLFPIDFASSICRSAQKRTWIHQVPRPFCRPSIQTDNGLLWLRPCLR